MQSRMVLGIVSFSVSVVLLTSAAQAQCSKDTDCKGDRVCEEGVCTASPPSAAGEPGAGAAAGVPTAAPAPTPNLVESTKAPAYAPPAAERAPGPEPKVAMRRHSTGMMAGGIVMVSFVPVALLVAWVADLEQSSCEGGGFFSLDGSESRGAGLNCGRFDATIYGGLLTAAALGGVGIPLIVIGGKKEPIAVARVSPWASPHSAGLGLRVDL